MVKASAILQSVKRGLSPCAKDGYPIVLTADRTLMSDYNSSEFIGFAACGARLLPDRLYKLLFCPSIPTTKDGKVKFAPCGTRKIEAVLLNNGFTNQDVVVAHPEQLNKVIGKNTRVLGITTNDPLGLGPASTTFSDLMGRESYNAKFFRDLVTHPLIRDYQLSVIVGGAGAWQLNDARIMAKFSIDTLCIGEGELVASELFTKAVNGDELPQVVDGGVVPVSAIPRIINPTINGLVEIARGCGRGCRFCSPTMLKYRSLPYTKIIEEVKVNVAGGSRIITLHAEDVLRYKAKGVIPNADAVIKLFHEVKKHALRIGISHFALASVVTNPKLVEQLSTIMGVGNREHPWTSGQTGIETGSAKLATEHLRGKAKPFKVDAWPEIVREAFGILHDAHWVPCATLILGMPKETSDDIIRTIELIEDLRMYKSIIVPLFFVPIGRLERARFFKMKFMTAEHWQLLALCIKHDFKWLYTLMDELFLMDNIKGMKAKSLRLAARYAERVINRYLKYMEQGEHPLKGALIS
jgi:radical SAM superfamily enzyme YgiQ (UPF0313 family)